MSTPVSATRDVPADGSQPLAGWYPAPDLQGQRYWDGGQWTDRWRQLPAPERSPQPRQGSPRSVGSTSMWGRLSVWCLERGWSPKVVALAGGLVAMTFTVVLILALSASAETPCERGAREYVESTDGTNGDYVGYLQGCRSINGPNG
ncbi:MAG: DUF2510 domain-containing protein [Cryobacterium sp.]|nr:DUF2510 domain-containing protein [Cryobacterium sp.]